MPGESIPLRRGIKAASRGSLAVSHRLAFFASASPYSPLVKAITRTVSEVRGTRWVVIVAALALSGLVMSATAGCGGSSSEATLKVASNAKLKQSIVVDAHGNTLYMFTVDMNGKAACVGDSPAAKCGKVWPPLTAKGKLQGGAGIDETLLGTTKRTDGQTQVTYNHHPLYYFRGYGGTPADKKSGDVNGQAFYGIWYVLSPKGTPITH